MPSGANARRKVKPHRSTHLAQLAFDRVSVHNVAAKLNQVKTAQQPSPFSLPPSKPTTGRKTKQKKKKKRYPPPPLIAISSGCDGLMLDYGGFPVMSDVPILMATMMRWIDAISKFLLVPNVSASSVSAWPSSPSFPRIGAASAATMPSIVAVRSTFTFLLQLHRWCCVSWDRANSSVGIRSNADKDPPRKSKEKEMQS